MTEVAFADEDVDLVALNPFLADVGDTAPVRETAFAQGRETTRAYLQREHVSTDKGRVDVLIKGIRSLLEGFGFVEMKHDNSATIFRHAHHNFEVMLHNWQGALELGKNAPLRDSAVAASKVSPEDLDVKGWTIAMHGDGPFFQGLTEYIRGLMPEMTPVQTQPGNTVYSLGHPVQHDLLEPTLVYSKDLAWSSGWAQQPGM